MHKNKLKTDEGLNVRPDTIKHLEEDKGRTLLLLLLLWLQSCLTLHDPIDGNPPCSPIPGSLQARTLEWATLFDINCTQQDHL